MDESYCYPAQQDLEHAWLHQRNQPILNLRCRGMNDLSFEKLYALMEKDNFGQVKLVDLDYNSITNQSVGSLYKMRERNINISLKGNCFNLELLPEKHIKFIADSTISNQLTHTSKFTPNSLLTEARLQIIEDKHTQIATNMLELQGIVKTLSTTSEILVKTVGDRSRTFEKQHKQIERNIANHLIEKYGYSTIDEDIKGYNKGTDVFLVSRDGKKVIIGEAKNELKTYAFTQVEMRRTDFRFVPREDLPERLKGWEVIIPLVGGNKIEEKFKTAAQEMKYVLAYPSHTSYSVTDYSGLL
ncbi:ribonuclease P protein component [Acrasis kona]|uniref:Ribonuclease P protein component n=1 Tax=Acrasis kona TaxID=1008807 RepID=A0AAW2Z1C9_9EUKA